MIKVIHQNKLCTNPPSDLKNEATILTANRRLAANWRERYDQEQQASGKQTWLSCDVLPLETWLERCWNETLDARIVLSDFQEELVWQQIIKNSNWGNALLRVDETAKSVQQAWRLIVGWGEHFFREAQHESAENPDTIAFQSWANAFINRCQTNKWLDRAQLPTLLIPQLKKISLPKKLQLVGFEEFPPQIQELLKAIAQQGTEIEYWQEQPITETQAAIALANEEEEIYTMARWTKQCLEKNQDAKIACIVPNLFTLRDLVARIFSEVFVQQDGFNISMGKLLKDFAFVQNTFLILKHAYPEQSLSDTTRLLRSPFLTGAAQEFSVRATLDKKLREWGEPQINLRHIVALARDSQANHHCPILATALQNFLDNVKNISGKKPPSEWTAFFNQLLISVGWPGDRTLNSEEYQLLQRWKKLLLEFAALDFILGEIKFSQALNSLQALANATIFQPQSSSAPVQILGVLEATGLQFDYLWLSSMDEENWPPRAYPNPFIAVKLQRQLNMPHSSAIRDFNFYRQLTQHFCNNSRNIICSFVQQQDEQTLRITPLLQHLPTITLEQMELLPFQTQAQSLWAQADLETYTDEQAPSITAAEKIAGGSAILKLQAACPFSAFAKFRLGATTLESPQLGLNYLDRGLLLHSALENLWNQIKDKTQLDSYAETELEKIVLNSIEAAIKEYIPNKPLTLKEKFTHIEKERLKKLLLLWLAEEKQRSDFKVLAKEQSQQITLGNINFRMRIDRIDQLPDGSHIIIDYKTSKTDVKDWFGERPDEPQLPLYCIASEKNISGIVYGQIRSEKIGFNGITIAHDVLPKVLALENFITKFETGLRPLSTLKEMTEQWRETLTHLAMNFYNGKANIDPKYGDETCQRCDLKTLCRIHTCKNQ